LKALKDLSLNLTLRALRDFRGLYQCRFIAKRFFKVVFCHDSKNKAISIGKYACAGG
jgi:hypothetical protein